MNIVLIGYRGTGKSTVSRILAFKLKRKLVRIDRLIAESAGVSIPDLVREQGWEAFRRIESAIVERVSASKRRVSPHYRTLARGRLALSRDRHRH